MPKYCLDTSGLSSPYEDRPEDIHVTMWNFIRQHIADGHTAVTKEIFDEIVLINGGLGDFLKTCKDAMLFEIDQDRWDWQEYLNHTNRMQTVYRQFISEYSGGSRRTICLNDLSIVSLAKTLNLPVISMEDRVAARSAEKRRIPDICDLENVKHLYFNDFLRAENYRD